MVAVRITGLHARTSAPSVRILQLHAQAAPIDPTPPDAVATVVISRLHAQAGPPLTGLQARAGLDKTAYGFDTVVLDGSFSIGATTGLSWSQIGGPSVGVLDGTDPIRTFTAPAFMSETVLTFLLTATSGSSTVTDSMTVTVAPWQYWRYENTIWVPIQNYFIGDGATPPQLLPDSGIFPDTDRRLRI